MLPSSDAWWHFVATALSSIRVLGSFTFMFRDAGFVTVVGVWVFSRVNVIVADDNWRLLM